MTTARLAVAVLLLAGAAPAAAAPRPTPFGRWTAVDAACPGCTIGPGAERGARLAIEPDGIRNPFAVDCRGAVAMVPSSRLRPRVAALVRRLRLPRGWASGRRDDRAATMRITCGGVTNTRIVMLGPNELLMPYEGGTYLRFTRDR